MFGSHEARVSKGPVEGRLQGKVALITGIGGGQGREVALLFARAGATVVGCDYVAAGLERTLAMAGEAGLRVEGSVFDATDEDAVKTWADAAAAKHGGIDILYNNAGFSQFPQFPDVSLDQWRESLRNELDIVFLPARAVWNHMIARGGGSIINIGAGLGVRGFEPIGGMGGTPHAAGKGGVIGFTNQLAAEGAQHWIRVNTISPGPILTDMVKHLIATNPGHRKMFEGPFLLPRNGRPVDIAYAGLFFASDESAFVTGVNMLVDGGSCSHIGLSFNYQPESIEAST